MCNLYQHEVFLRKSTRRDCLHKSAYLTILKMTIYMIGLKLASVIRSLPDFPSLRLPAETKVCFNMVHSLFYCIFFSILVHFYGFPQVIVGIFITVWNINRLLFCNALCQTDTSVTVVRDIHVTTFWNTTKELSCDIQTTAFCYITKRT
jgi:Ni/Fe-hydrogenase subunit HybB-like protein